jgi:DnaJ-class molecular chaperone
VLLPSLGLLFVGAAPSANPYQVLGVSPSSSSHDIQKQYRIQCLKYHPDKNVNKNKREREKCEEMFKWVQHAYALIGTNEARNKFDAFGDTSNSARASTSSSAQYTSSTPFGSDPVAQAFARAFQSAGNRGPRFYFSKGRFGVQNPFPDQAFTSAAGLSFKSIYIQDVKISLADLYKGQSNFRFHLVDNLWTRCRAAIRGKVILISIYQGLIYSLPLLRTSRFLACFAGFVIVHATLPKPSPQAVFESTLRPGLKGGETKVKFASTSFMTPEVIFNIQESPHESYKRVGNDLHTEVKITTEEALNGCTKRILSLDESASIEFTIKPDKLQNGDTVRIVGKGWPIKNAEDIYFHGDMIVRVWIQRSSQTKRKGRKGQRQKRNKNREFQ